MKDSREFYRRHLPHWQPQGATFFITFRLANSLPQSVIAELKQRSDRESRKLRATKTHKSDQNSKYDAQRREFARWDTALDKSKQGSDWLNQPQIAEIIVEALHYRDQRVYDLFAFCVMPNHVHLVCRPLSQDNSKRMSITRILQSLKRHTAAQANKLLERRGAFWQSESYDHVVRDEKEFERILRYVVENPVKAGLVNHWQEWPWTYLIVDYPDI